MVLKPIECQKCPLNRATGTAFVPTEVGKGSILLVGEAPGEQEAEDGKPFVGGSGAFLNNLLKRAGIERNDTTVANVICCRPPNNIFPLDFKWRGTSRQDAREGVEYCKRTFLEPLVKSRDWKKIIAVGDQPLTALTPRKGIMVWRGSPLPLKWDLTKPQVLPTLHPAYLLRDMKLTSCVITDLQKSLKPVPELYNLYATPNDLRAFRSAAFAFDFEWNRDGDITLCGLSEKFYHATVSGWYGDAIGEFRRIFEQATDLIGHNIIGADTRHFEKYGWAVTARLHDTMLKQHLVQPDFRHGLGFVASVFTNKVFWKGKGEEQEDADGNIIEVKEQWRTWDRADAIPRELGGYGGCTSADEAYRLYNARDTDSSFQINHHLDQLLKRYNLENVYWNVSLPIAFIVRDISDCGIAIDTSKVKQIRRELGDQIQQLEETLPEGLKPYDKPITRQIPAPKGTYKAKRLKCKGTKKAKTAHEEATWEVSTPGASACPTCGKVYSVKLAEVKRVKVPSSKRIQPWNSSAQVLAYAKRKGIKEHINRKKGTATADVYARKIWGRQHTEFRIIDKLKDLGTERNNFAKAEMERVDRLYFNLLVHGTSEGRFSSSGRRPGVDPNIQNQPKSIRKIYIPDTPTDCFIELDYAGGENWLTAWLAQDKPRLERLRQPGYSEHLELAKLIFSLPAETSKAQASDWQGQDLYDVAKHINHGSNYGMTHVKFKEYCEGEGLYFSEKECKAFIAKGKELNPGTSLWQAATIEAARRDGFLRNVFGRMRWFSTRDIATKSLAFLPASTLADIVIRAMIAHHPVRFAKECLALGLQRVGELLEGWRIAIQVHDSLVLHGPAHSALEQAARTKALMTQPWAELNGFSLNVETKVGAPGQPWGGIQTVHV